MRLLGTKDAIYRDRFEVKLRDDGTAEEPCWFCGGAVTISKDGVDDAAAILVEPLGRDGERLHGICHASCAGRAHGSLRL